MKRVFISLFFALLAYSQQGTIVVGGNGPPGTVPISQVGYLYVDTSVTPMNLYSCFQLNCTAVGPNNWTLTSSVSPLVGILASRPTLCNPGNGFSVFFQAIDQSAGNQLFLCTSQNTWTLIGGGGGGGGGTVTSVALSMPVLFTVANSPVTTSGTINVTLNSQSANSFLASPSSSSGVPSFRTLTTNDLPALTTGSSILYGNGSGGFNNVTIGSGLNFSSGVLTGTNFGGTVTSFSSGSLSPLFTTSVASSTTTPDLTFTLSNAGANTWFGNATGSSAAPSFNSAPIPANFLPNPSSTTLGGIESYASVSHQWINTISTSGVPSSTQPGFTDISGSVSCGQLPALTGDTTSSACATTTSKINDTAFPTSALAVGSNSSAQPITAVTQGTGSKVQTASGTTTSGDCPNYDSSGALVDSGNPCGTGTGTVTSVGLSLPGIFSVSGSPVTLSGTLTGTLTTETANTVFSGPTSGGAATPTFRSLVGTDLPNPSATTLGGIESLASTSHEWINAISTSGVPSATQPAFSDLSGSATCAQLPALTGDATSPAGFCATSVVKINGGSVPASANVLGSNSSSQPVSATATNVVNLFGSCSGTQYLGADGNCHSASGAGTVTSIATSCGVTGGTITTSGTISGSEAVNAQTGTSYTVVSGDCGKLLTFTSGSAVTVTVPQAGTTGFGAGVYFDVYDYGTGNVTVTPTTSTIVGGPSQTLRLGQGFRVVSDGTNYQITQYPITVSTPLQFNGSVINQLNCSTCVTSAASLSNNQLIFGSGGAQGVVSNSLTISAGTGMSGGGSASPGATLTLNQDTASLTRGLGAAFDGSGTALTSGSTATVYFTVPFACTISAWNITVDTGTITFDVWKVATGTAIPTVTNTITASALPAISSGTAVHSTTLTGWTTSVSTNDIFGVNINTVSSATKASLILQCNIS